MTETPEPRRARRSTAGWVAAWLLAAAASVAVGVLAVGQVGATLRDRGPIGDNELIRQAELAGGSSAPDPEATVVRREFTEEFGTLVVECRGVFAYGIGADTAPGWQTITLEPGPDDDVDAIFSSGSDSVEVEVFCNRGEPTVSDLERQTLEPDDD